MQVYVHMCAHIPVCVLRVALDVRTNLSDRQWLLVWNCLFIQIRKTVVGQSFMPTSSSHTFSLCSPIISVPEISMCLNLLWTYLFFRLGSHTAMSAKGRGKTQQSIAVLLCCLSVCGTHSSSINIFNGCGIPSVHQILFEIDLNSTSLF